MNEESPAIMTSQIVAFNDAWKAIAAISGRDSMAARELRDVKALLQIRLLRAGYAHLAPDTDGRQDLWSVRLNHPLRSRVDACHLPRAVAEALLLPSELLRLSGGHHVG